MKKICIFCSRHASTHEDVIWELVEVSPQVLVSAEELIANRTAEE